MHLFFSSRQNLKELQTHFTIERNEHELSTITTKTIQPNQTSTNQSSEKTYASIFPPTYLPNENLRKQPVTKQDIRKTKSLLRDFGVPRPYGFNLICNSFSTYAELENWRRYYIKKELDRMEKEGLIVDEED